MFFPEEWFEDEIREGYYVPSAQKRLWAAQMEILQDIDRICKENGLRWFMAFGTLLGAVRHKGYIPWDDDVDIYMLREDFLQFEKIVQGMPKEYEIHWVYEHYKYIPFCARMNALPFLSQRREKYHDYIFLCGVDIFVLDNVCPENPEEMNRSNLCRLLGEVAETLDWELPEDVLKHLDGGTDAEFAELLRQDQELVRKLEDMLGIPQDESLPLKKRMRELFQELFLRFHGKKTEYVALLYAWIWADAHLFQREHFERQTYLPFERTFFPAPQHYDKVLEILYGDYHKIVRTGGGHEFLSERGREDLVAFAEEQGAKLPFDYHFQREDLFHEKTKVPGNREAAKVYLELLGRYHALLEQGLHRNTGSPDNLLILQQCQETAIRLGNFLEKEYGEGCPAIPYVETYCEAVYQAYCGLQAELSRNVSLPLASFAMGKTGDLLSRLTEGLSALEKSIREELPARKEVVFLPFKASAWASMESVWKACVEDPYCDPYVVPIPYGYRDMEGEFRGEMRYDGQAFPEYVPIVDYREYDLFARHPDVVFIQNPYDYCNQVMSVPPKYYSSELSKAAGCLVYIPWFVTDETDFDKPECKPEITNMKFYVTVPALSFSDLVILQSEQMKKTYVEVLSEFAGEDTRKIWKEKILGLGSPIYDREEGNPPHGFSDVKASPLWEAVLGKIQAWSSR